MTDREEMESILQKGAEILSIHPRIVDKALEDILNELDDGTSEMRQNRWGAVARAVIAHITSYDVKSLVPKLAEVENRGFICEYVGYLLLVEYKVNLEELLLEAERQGHFDKIVPFIGPNLQYETEFFDSLLCVFFAMLNRHADSQFYSTVIANYAEHILNLGVEYNATKLLGDLAGETELHFVCNITQPWYKKNSEQARTTVGELLTYPGIWSRKAGLNFLEISLWECETDFLKYYSQVELLIQSDQELWIAAIPVLVLYILNYDCTNSNEKTYTKVLSRLQNIPDGRLEERQSFLCALQWKAQIKESLDLIFQAIIRRPFEKDSIILSALDIYLYRTAHKKPGTEQQTLDTMFAAFSSSGFGINFSHFFDRLHGITHHLAQTVPSMVSAFALNYILAGGTNQLYFGLGLLTKAGSLSKLFQEQKTLTIDFPEHLTNDQLVYIMKGFLYCTFDSKAICQTAFQLLLFAEESGAYYIQFCVDEVFAHYPGTMHTTAIQFKENGTDLQIQLAEQVECAYLQSSESCATSYKIKDFASSQEHQRIYQKLQTEVMQQAKENHKESFLLDMFSSRVLKYGARFGWVMHGEKGQLFYKVSSPAHISHQIELSAEYVNDPIQAEMKRIIYLEEVRNRATDNQGLPTTAERKG